MKPSSILLAASLAWYLMIPSAPIPDAASTVVPDAQADTGDDSPQWLQFGSAYSTRAGCEAERTSLISDPVVGEQMQQARCTEAKLSPPK